MTYSDKYNRLYLSFDGEQKFGNLQIGEDAPLVLTLVDPDNKQHIVPVDKAIIHPYKASESAPVNYYILLFNQSYTDTVTIESITADIKCEIQNIPAFPLIPRLLVSVTMIPETSVQSDTLNASLTISYNNGRRQQLPVSLLRSFD